MNKIFFVLFFLSVSIGACKKGFLDREPYTAVPVATAIKTVEEMGAAVNGVYASLRGAGIYGRTIPIMGDLMADNVYISTQNSGRYTVQNNYSTTVVTAEPDGIWTGLYSVIKNANLIINADIPASPLTDVARDQFRGEALTMRAWAYFDLARWFAKPFTVDANAIGVPILLDFDQNAKPSRESLADVYARILADLNQAFSLMTQTKSSAYITKYVARGLQARVYQHMGDWSKARDAALDVVTNSGFTLVTASGYVSYWRNPAPLTNKVETMFELSLDAANNNGTNALAYIYDPAGYGDMLATTSLFNLHTATDVRRNFFVPGTRAGQSVFYVSKYANGNSVDKDDVKMMRLSEIVLILAEAYYRLADETNARLYLNMIATRRDPSFTGYTSTGTQLLEDILNERRKELAFEGFRFQDFQRLNLVIDRGAQAPAAARTITTDNHRRIQPIPQSELDANPEIGQNAGY
ncbi:MAG TPA: RagB/SusD family nutrient uptake outer membrane protein [Chitinophagaceae bacterium]